MILKKLVYYKEGNSQKHLRDISSVLRIQNGRIDRQYISLWAKELHVSDIWNLVDE